MTKWFTVTLHDVVKIINDGTEFGEPIPVLVLDPSTGRLDVVRKSPPGAVDATIRALAGLAHDVVVGDLTAVRDLLTGDPAQARSLLPIGAQAAWYAEQPLIPAEISTLFRQLSARLIETGLSRTQPTIGEPR